MSDAGGLFASYTTGVMRPYAGMPIWSSRCDNSDPSQTRTATQADFLTYLPLLTSLTIRESFTATLPPNAIFVTGFDNIRFTELPPTTPSTVPEPATLTLLGLGLAGIGARHRRRRQGHRLDLPSSRKLYRLLPEEETTSGMNDAGRVTELLREWREGDDQAFDRLVPFVYAELRRLARGQLRREQAGHSLQPTALVHEAYLRLVKADVDWQDRTHFLSVAARVMRRVLVEHARSKGARKRGGDEQHVTLTGPIAAPDADPIGVLVLDSAMERLQLLDARQARIVELCYFGGLTCLEAGQALGISEPTVQRNLRHARAWLRRELSGK